MIHEKIHNIFTNSATSLTTYVIENFDEIEENRKRPAIIICPGGGYKMISEREAEPIALKMISYGFHAFVLSYSISPNIYPTALVELAKSVQLVRKNKNEWNIDSNKIIVAGFSAGGHLAANLGVSWNQTFLSQWLKGENDEWKPNGLLLSYPVITSDKFIHEDSFKNLLGNEYYKIRNRLSGMATLF